MFYLRLLNLRILKPPFNLITLLSCVCFAGLQEEADRGAASGGAPAEAAAAGASVPGVSAAAAGTPPAPPGQEAAIPLQRPGPRHQRQAGLGYGGKMHGPHSLQLFDTLEALQSSKREVLE